MSGGAMIWDREQKRLFDQVALDYEQARPGYPEALIRDVVSLSGVAARGAILEIG